MADRASAVRQRLERHPRVWGAVLAVALLALYVVALKPARLFVAEHVAYPAFASIETPRAEALTVARTPGRPDAVWAYPTALAAGRDAQTVVYENRDAVAEWAAPVGVIFLLPALLLVAVYPSRPFWLWLLGYHVVLGVVSAFVFALGVGYVEAAFAVYTFSRTYLAEAVSLVVPLLLLLSGGAFGALAPAPESPAATDPAAADLASGSVPPSP